MSKKMSYFHSKLGSLNISPAGDGLTAEKTRRLLKIISGMGFVVCWNDMNQRISENEEKN